MLALLPPLFSALTSLWNLLPFKSNAYTHTHTRRHTCTHTHTPRDTCWVTCLHTHLFSSAHAHQHTHLHNQLVQLCAHSVARLNKKYTHTHTQMTGLLWQTGAGEQVCPGKGNKSVCSVIKGVAAKGGRRKHRERNRRRVCERESRQTERERGKRATV